MHRGLWVGFFFAISILFVTSFVHAAAIGVSKGVLDFENVLKNGYAEDSFYVSTDIKDNVSLVYQFEGPFKGWMTVKQGTDLVMSKDHGQWLTVVVTPPADTANGIYDGIMRVTTGPLQPNFEGRIGSTVLAAFSLQVRVVVTGKETLECIPGGYSIPDQETGRPIEMRVMVSNTGNVRLQPAAHLTFYDQAEKKVVAEQTVTFADQVLPTTTAALHATVPDLDLPLGQYFVKASIPQCGPAEEQLTFSVLEKGQVSDTGEFQRIENPYAVKVHEIVPIAAIFHNSGNRTVIAKFKGTIRSGNAVIKVIDTDTVNVLPLETARIEAFYEADKPGTYQIQGRILYNSKLTFEQGSVLNVVATDEYVQSERQKQRINLLSFIPLVGLLILILLFILLIKRKMRGEKRRIVK